MKSKLTKKTGAESNFIHSNSALPSCATFYTTIIYLVERKYNDTAKRDHFLVKHNSSVHCLLQRKARITRKTIDFWTKLISAEIGDILMRAFSFEDISRQKQG